MLPTPIITALSVARLDIGHLVGVDRQIAVGAAILTAELRGPLVQFSLGSCVLQPSDPAGSLLTWLDEQLLREGATIARYRLDDDAALLDHLPGAEWSPCIRALAGCGQQYALNLTASRDGEPLTFAQACANMGILCAPSDPGRRFAAWLRSDVSVIARDVEVDAIAVFRLVIRRLAALNPVGRSIAAVISNHLAAWLGEADHPAAQAHVADLLSAAD
ncbi:hypothetical protein [Sphingomonas adhaesiva]|uniref:hypothetical protein n=1 Tax=Sphingomonas adhaesiva TaxID=28212 RepID=UPI002FF90A19